MKAGFSLSIAAGFAALAAVGAAAQTAPATAPAQQPSVLGDTVGPRELRDFSLGETPARPSEPSAQEAPPAAQLPAPARSSSVPATNAPAARSQSRAPAAPIPDVATANTAALEPLPNEKTDFAPSPAPLETAPIEESAPVQATPVPSHSNAELLLPWLLAGLVMMIGAVLMMLRQRSQRTIAGVGAEDSFEPSEPRQSEPQPLQRNVSVLETDRMRPPVGAATSGIVSTRLRPWIEVELTPGRCILDQAQVTVEFLIKVTNSGNANARQLRIDTMLFNAGPTQDQDIGAFFAHPMGRGEALDSLAPLKGVEMRSSVTLPMGRLQLLEISGRRVFVPLIGFNALYRWGSGEGQTSLSFLLGREGEGERMAPFRADLGPRIFRGIGARELQLKVRR